MEHTVKFCAFIIICVGMVSCAPEEQQPRTDAPVAQTTPETFKMPREPAPPGAATYIISPADGAQVTSPVRVVFGLKGIGVAPASVDMPNTGHHHLLVDTELSNTDVPVPKDEQHLHFGNGQTEALVELAEGSHRLQLVLGDYLHIPHEPPVMSEPINIEVTAAE